MSKHETFMRRALELASLGLGDTYPNPMVGCVIVKDGKIIGEGWHQKAGEGHAEVRAVKSLGDESLVKGADVYVSLEPCAHHGKTPPCADLMVRLMPKRVFICNVDSNPLVGGKGVRKMTDVGIEVHTGILEQEGRELNKRFFNFMEKKRPYIILKWAQTSDGFIARENYDSKWISSPLSRRIVHKWRSEERAIMVGSGTALHDDPSLNVRDWAGHNPIRVVVDRKLKLPSDLKLFTTEQATLRYNTLNSDKSGNTQNIQLTESDFLTELFSDLHAGGIQSIFVEGGTGLINQLLAHNLWDEARIFTAPTTFVKGICAPQVGGELWSKETIGRDILKILHNINCNFHV